jgi:6-phosphogluconolactonase
MIYLGGYSAPRGTVVLARETGSGLALESTVDCPANPTYLALAADRRTLYASHELDEGTLSAFALDPGGAPRLLGSWASGGALPCHLSVHPSGRFVLTAHWGSGELAVHPVGADGSLGEARHVLPTGKAAAHMIRCDPTGRWVLAVHLGLGTVTTYRLDPDTGRLYAHAVAALPPTSGPRHLAFHPTGAGPTRPLRTGCGRALPAHAGTDRAGSEHRVYIVNELHSTLTAASFDPETGRLALGGTVSTLPAGVELTNHPSAVLVSPDGRHVYVANRFHDSVAVFGTSPRLRLLATYPCGGDFPRDLALTPDGARLYVANERSGAVAGFLVDPADGSLTPSGVPLTMPGPACVLPADRSG